MWKYQLFSAVSIIALTAASPSFAEDPNTGGEESCLTQQTDIFRNPFSADSAHHRPIGSDAEYSSNDEASTQEIRNAGFGNINTNNGWGVNVYQVKDGDPTVTVTAIEDGEGYKGGAGLPVTMRIPEGAHNKNSDDGLIAVVDGDTAHEFYVFKWNNGHPTAKLHYEVNLKELGHTTNGERVGMTAGGTALMMGLLRGYEINTPGCKIQHVLQVALSHGNYPNSCPEQLEGESVWPAVSTDWFCKASPGSCKGNIPYGSLLALPRSVNLSDYKLSEPGQRLAEAMQNYGAYVIDGALCAIMRADQFVTDETRKALIVDMHKIWSNIRIVKNNKKDQTTSGGGETCAENNAYNSPQQQYVASGSKCGGTTPPPGNNEEPPHDTPPPDNTNPPENPVTPGSPPKDNPDSQPIDNPKYNDPPKQENPPKKENPKHAYPTPIDPIPVDPSPSGPPTYPAPADPPKDNVDNTMKEKISQWLWENLDHSKEGFKTFWNWMQVIFS